MARLKEIVCLKAKNNSSTLTNAIVWAAVMIGTSLTLVHLGADHESMFVINNFLVAGWYVTHIMLQRKK